MPDISDADLLDALQGALSPTNGEEGVTTADLCAHFNRSAHVIRAAIRRLLEAGRMEVVDVIRHDMRGRRQRVAGYRFVKKPS